MKLTKKTAGLAAAAAVALGGLGVAGAQPAYATGAGQIETLAGQDPYVVVANHFGVSAAELRQDFLVKHMSADQIAAKNGLTHAQFVTKATALASRYILPKDQALVRAMIEANASKHY